MGASRARTIWSVVFPTARSGITTAVVLGIARAVGETAPLLFTAFGYDLMNSNPFNGPQESLPLFVYRNIRKPEPRPSIARGFTGALVLMLLVLALFALARFIGRDRSQATAGAAPTVGQPSGDTSRPSSTDESARCRPPSSAAAPAPTAAPPGRAARRRSS